MARVIRTIGQLTMRIRRAISRIGATIEQKNAQLDEKIDYIHPDTIRHLLQKMNGHSKDKEIDLVNPTDDKFSPAQLYCAQDTTGKQTYKEISLSNNASCPARLFSTANNSAKLSSECMQIGIVSS